MATRIPSATSTVPLTASRARRTRDRFMIGPTMQHSGIEREPAERQQAKHQAVRKKRNEAASGQWHELRQ